MSQASPPPGDQPEAKPGKIRTWWHPLLANFLRWQLGSHYDVQEEVPVGKKPLQIDLLLLHKEQGELPVGVRQILAGLVEHLGEYTLLEFKSPSDTLRAGDFQTFLAYALLYRAQNDPLLDPSRLHLLVLAPRLTRPYREELRVLGVTAQQQQKGIWQLHGGLVLHPTWALETEELAGLEHPLLTLVSPTFLANRVGTYEMLRQAGHTELVVYLAQQIHLFRLLGKEFAMQHLGAEDELKQVMRDIWATMSPEERLEVFPLEKRLEGLSPEERLEGLSPEERLEGLSPEERLHGLTAEDLRKLPPEELERLRRLLQQLPPGERKNGAS
jgi:hypothetical protein